MEIRRAEPSDADGIAEAHLDSIRSLGAMCYPPDVVDAWGAHVAGDLYIHAMARGERFFIAVDESVDPREILGFSCHHASGSEHGTAVYVRGKAARRGVGSALFRAAEASAAAAGASTIEIDASIAAVGFYKAQGFEEIGRGDHRLPTGRSMTCVFMRKRIRDNRENSPQS